MVLWQRRLYCCVTHQHHFSACLPHPLKKSISDLIFDIYMHVYVCVFLKETIVSMTRLWQGILTSVKELYEFRLGSKNIRELIGIKFKFPFRSRRDWTTSFILKCGSPHTVAFRSRWPSIWGSWAKQETHNVTEGELWEPTGCGHVQLPAPVQVWSDPSGSMGPCFLFTHGDFWNKFWSLSMCLKISFTV